MAEADLTLALQLPPSLSREREMIDDTACTCSVAQQCHSIDLPNYYYYVQHPDAR
jgi:hypothetical protein